MIYQRVRGRIGGRVMSGLNGQHSGRAGMLSGVAAAIAGMTLNWASSPGNLLPSGFSLTRASDGTYFDSAGLLQTAGANVARFSYNPLTLALKGLMVEQAATNLRLRSNAFSTAPWDTSNIDAIAQNATGPLGANTAWTLTDSNAGAYRYIQAAFSSVVTPGSTYTDWILVGKTTGTPGNFPGIEIQSIIDSSCIVQTTTGTLTVLSAGATWAIYNYSPDFWLVAATYVAGLTSSNIVLFPALSSNGTTASTAATGSAVFSLATTELGTAPTSYIATGAASATRNADVLTAPTSGLLVNGQGLAAIGGELIAPGPVVGGSFTYLSTYTAGGEGVPIYQDVNGMAIYDGTAVRNWNATSVLTAPTVGSTFSIATTWGGSSCNGAYNGTLGTLQTFDGSMNLATTMRIGNSVGGLNEPISMYLKALRLGVQAVNNSRLANPFA